MTLDRPRAPSRRVALFASLFVPVFGGALAGCGDPASVADMQAPAGDVDGAARDLRAAARDLLSPGGDQFMSTQPGSDGGPDLGASDLGPALGACDGQGPLSFAFGSGMNALPVPGDPRVVSVTLQGMVMDKNGSLVLDPDQMAKQPIYRVVLKADCADKPRSWKRILVDRVLQPMSDEWVTARAGNVAAPDNSWQDYPTVLKGESNDLKPHLAGDYIELNFVLIAADRTAGAALRGFRACYGCGADGQ